jgi:hypothetical protein
MIKPKQTQEESAEQVTPIDDEGDFSYALIYDEADFSYYGRAIVGSSHSDSACSMGVSSFS